MALTKFTTDIENIQALSDKPNEVEGLTANQLKKKFDDGAIDIKTYLNETLTDEIDTQITTLQTDWIASIVDNLTSTSATNALSANMGRELNTRHIITANLANSLSITSTSATKIPLALYNSTGSKLSIDSEGIKVGAGVSKVLVSAQAAHATLAAAGLKQLRVYVGSTQTATTRTQIATANSTINISQYLLDVAENDIIYLYYVGVNGDTVGVGVNYDTWLTVERVA